MERRRLIRWSVAFTLFAGIVASALAMRGCGESSIASDPENFPLSRTVDDPASADAGSVDLLSAGDFHFTMGDGSGWSGYNVVKIGADGSCQYTFFEWVTDRDASGNEIRKPQWKRAVFSLDAGTLADLRKLLAEVDFFRLKKEYDANVEDGTQRWVKVEASGKHKGVYCNNHFPQPFKRICRFVNNRIIAAHPAQIAAARKIELDPKDRESESFD